MQRVYFGETSLCRISPLGQPHQRTRPQVLIFHEKGITTQLELFPLETSLSKDQIFSKQASHLSRCIYLILHCQGLDIHFISASLELLPMEDMNNLFLWNHHKLEHEGNTQLLLRTRHQHITCWPKAFALESTCLLLWNPCFSHSLNFKTIV